MKHIALVPLFATLIAISSCATDKEEMPGEKAALAPPGKADDAIVCRFGGPASDTDQKKGCTTVMERQNEKPDLEAEAEKNQFPTSLDPQR